MAIYEFLIECKDIAIKNGFMAEVRRITELLDCLSIEEASKEI